MVCLLYNRYRRHYACDSPMKGNEMPAMIQENARQNEQPPLGYVTHTRLADGDDVIYGVFNTIDEAIAFGDKLIAAIIKPIYRPTLH